MRWFSFNIKNFTVDEYNKWYSLMSDEKKKRVDKFRYADDKKRTVAGEMLVRKAVAERCNINAEKVTFTVTENGKPYIPHLNIEFNISHSEDMVVCALDDSPIGIDIEKIRPIDLKIAKKAFSDEDCFYLFGHTPTGEEFVFTEDADMLKRFFRLWTKKEAYGKYTGQGLFAEYTGDCNFEFIENISGYILCICSKNNLPPSLKV